VEEIRINNEQLAREKTVEAAILICDRIKGVLSTDRGVDTAKQAVEHGAVLSNILLANAQLALIRM
jgi:hypothetical protein